MNDGYFILPAGAQRARCRSCQAEIAYIITARGQRMPLDVAKSEERDGQTWALTHFATCPEGKAWSQKGKAR